MPIVTILNQLLLKGQQTVSSIFLASKVWYQN